ncbi:MAG: rod shape-determining protein MreC [Comamonadaceae bacterium]|nr:MAG: rod shape-determining protein MreC [Comamonadaceae bacterium]
MPLGTLDRSAPPLFQQGPSALSKLIFFSALSLFLMVADARFHLVQPMRAAVSALLYPVQWLAMKPVQLAQGGGQYLSDLKAVQASEAQAHKALAAQSERASLVDALQQENARLRAMLELRATSETPGRVAEVMYDAADPYTRKIVIDQGSAHGIAAGSPVIDAQGVLGQVTQAQPFTSEVTLVIDRDLSIPVQNVRTGARSVAYGDANVRGGGLELRFMQANADVQVGDLLSTSGVDGVYPPGLPVARIDRIDRRADSAFARIHCVALAQVTAARYVMVLAPVGAQMAPRPAPAASAAAAKAQQQHGRPAPAATQVPGRAEARRATASAPVRSEVRRAAARAESAAAHEAARTGPRP